MKARKKLQAFALMLIMVLSIVPLAFANGDGLQADVRSRTSVDSGDAEIDSETEVKLDTETDEDSDSETDDNEDDRTEDESSDNSNDKSDDDSEKRTRKRSRVDVRQDGDRVEIRSEARLRAGENKFRERFEFKARALDKIKVQRARENFLAAKSRFEAAQDNYAEARARFEERKEELLECQESEDDCSDIEAEVEANAKAQISNAADQMLAHLEQIKAKIQENEDLTEEEAAELTAKVDAQIAEVQELKEQAENAETKDEVVETAKALAAKWNTLRAKAKAHLSKSVNAKIGGIVARSEHLADKLERKLARLEEAGADISVAEELVAEFHAHLDQAHVHYEQALEVFAEVRADGDVDTDKVREAQELLKDAREELREANKVLKDILKEVRETAADVGEDADLDNDIDESEEDDSDEDDESDEDSEDDEQELEIEVEIKDGSADVEVEMDGEETEFSLETDNEDEIVAEISARTGLSEAEVRAVAVFERDE